MLVRIVEEIAEAYFQLKGYMVLRNYPIPASGKRRIWTDIDVLAFNNEKLFIVQCKRGSLNQERREKLVEWFHNAEKHIREIEPFRSFVEKLGLEVIRLYVAWYVTRRDEEWLSEKGIRVVRAENMVREMGRDYSREDWRTHTT
ncbi:MAG: hypothetical protein DRK00_08835 [Thermoprotei archaeon]|nr:MAG: hypothetical protein DRK00_08835 [Thermoprotei archaeon]